MCTVTFIPTSKGVWLTSNRDESEGRAEAIHPACSEWGGMSFLYPKDPVGGGTWIALRDEKTAVVLLNGAFDKHEEKGPYRKSRGLILLDIIQKESPVGAFEDIYLKRIEPFTLIVYAAGRLSRCTWDGTDKNVQDLDASKAYIWSSATIYDHEARRKRETEFTNWLTERRISSGRDVVEFHAQQSISGRAVTNMFHEKLATVSITSVLLDSEKPVMHYHDLRSGKASTTFCRERSSLPLPNFQSLHWRARRFSIRFRNWEYWPFAVVYGPMLPIWLWLSLRARSLLFFSAANPTIQNSGFINERKSDIYELIPKEYYPDTLVCRRGLSLEKILEMIRSAALTFPMIAKPDVGQRGLQVKLLQDIASLDQYRLESKVDFLLQRYIDYPNEIGVFYYRLPGEKRGHVSGIVGKALLSVTGDGKNDLLSLMMQNERAVLQIPALAGEMGQGLREIPEKGQLVTLAPYGNHSRGARFVDLSHKITPNLTRSIDDICRTIPGFYYGRLDIRFQDWNALDRREQFSIIEVNGAGSEPAHIYDPGHSIWFAWREIFRHWKLLFDISMANAKSGKQSLMTAREGIAMRRDHRRYLALLNTRS